jgi:YidC/Oxa1 family membrane protein insertase
VISLDPIYYAISWVMLKWHALWAAVGLDHGQFLGTNWDWVLAVFFLVITIRVVLFPLYVKQIKSQRAMQALQPRIKELQAKYKGDKQAMQQELMALYKTEKANPLMGCLPLVLQAPVLISLFHVLRHLSHPDSGSHQKTLYGWSESLFNSAAHAHLFGAPIAAGFRSPKSLVTELDSTTLNVQIIGGILIALMILTTYLTQRQMIARTGWATDPQQKMVQRLMLYGVPVMLLISGSIFPIGVVIYWTTSNLFSLGQQMWILHKYPPPKNAAKDDKPPKPGSKAAAKVAEERAEAAAAAKALAPKVGARPTARKRTTARPAAAGAADPNEPTDTVPTDTVPTDAASDVQDTPPAGANGARKATKAAKAPAARTGVKRANGTAAGATKKTTAAGAAKKAAASGAAKKVARTPGKSAASKQAKKKTDT